jgi:chorismate dehydratase
VLSVRLVHRGPLQQVRRVALDTSSRTSAALIRILLRERLGRDPEYVPAAPDIDAMLASADAALLIGDPALALPPDTPCLDLGQAWWELTSLPFVYAIWAGRPGCVGPALIEALQESLLHGLASIPALAAAYNGGGAQAGLYETYLRDHIAFALGAAERAGLAEFFRRAHGLGLIPRAPELRFHGHP